MEHFYTLQGEGYHQGRAAYFIRLGGCDVGCVWCDVKDSWDAEKHPLFTIDDLLLNIEKTPAKLVVITGGEPLMHNLAALTTALHAKGLETNIETSGAHPLSGSWDWICLSPKKFKLPLEENYQKAHELKMIIFNQHDFKWAEELKQKVNANCKLYIQPEWDKSAEVLPMMIDYVKRNTEWALSLQTHKYLNIP